MGMSDHVFDSLEGLQHEAYERGVRDEREACAQVCEAEEKRVDDLADEITPEGNLYMAGKAVSAKRCAKNIRARSNASLTGAEP